jgi:hypothetical protein
MLITALLSCLPFAPLRAQETSSMQVFGGYSAETLRGPDGGCSRYSGWNASVARRLFWKVSFVADIGGHYGREHEVVENRVHTFLSGPRVTLHNGRITPFVQVLFGLSRLRADAGGPVLSMNAFTLGAGGGADLRITRRWSVRMIQMEYLRREWFGEPRNGGRIAGGMVFHFGE